MLFFVKVRIDVDQVVDLGKALADGSLDCTALRSTYCHRFDPEVGLNIWEAEDLADFRQRFAPHRAYYRDLLEVTPVITPEEAMHPTPVRKTQPPRITGTLSPSGQQETTPPQPPPKGRLPADART